MSSKYTNTTQIGEGRKLTAQTPIDDRWNFKTIADVIASATQIVDPLSWHASQPMYLDETNTDYVWLRVDTINSFVDPTSALIPSGFKYPDFHPPSDGVDYSDPNTGEGYFFNFYRKAEYSISTGDGDMLKEDYDSQNGLLSVNNARKLNNLLPAYYDQNGHVTETAPHLSTSERAAMDVSNGDANPPSASNGFATKLDVQNAGGGDMLKSVYDTVTPELNTNKVDRAKIADLATDATNAANAAVANEVPWTGVQNHPDFSLDGHTHVEGDGTNGTILVDKYTQAEIDGFTVKLTGDQTVAGVKTFASVVKGVTPVANEDLVTKEYVDQTGGLGEAPNIPNARYLRSELAWSLLEEELTLLPSNTTSIPLDNALLGYQIGTINSTSSVEEFFIDPTDIKLGAKFTIVSGAISTPEYSGGFTVNVVAGLYVPGLINVIRGEYIGDNVIQIAYDKEVSEDPSAVIYNVISSSHVCTQSDNGKTLVCRFQGDTTITIPSNLNEGWQVSVKNLTSNNVHFVKVDSGIDLAMVGTTLETNNTSATIVDYGTYNSAHVVGVDGALTTP